MLVVDKPERLGAYGFNRYRLNRNCYIRYIADKFPEWGQYSGILFVEKNHLGEWEMKLEVRTYLDDEHEAYEMDYMTISLNLVAKLVADGVVRYENNRMEKKVS